MRTTTVPPNPGQSPMISFPFKGGVYRFSPADIIHLKAESNYTYIHVRDHKPILMAKVLSAYASILEPFGFLRIHRSHLINPDFIRFVSPTGKVIMEDHSKAEVARRRRRDFIDLMLQREDAA